MLPWLVPVALAIPPLSLAAEADPCAPDPAVARVYDGVSFPLGDAAFADRVVSFEVGGNVQAAYGDPTTALGPPDWAEGVGAVSLGRRGKQGGAEIVLAFEHAVLRDVPGIDLWIFEVGPSVESTRVSVSTNGRVWVDLGLVKGSTRGIDLAEHGVDPSAAFSLVRLVDATSGRAPGPWAGPDIDAVGIIGGCRSHLALLAH